MPTGKDYLYSNLLSATTKERILKINCCALIFSLSSDLFTDPKKISCLKVRPSSILKSPPAAMERAGQFVLGLLHTFHPRRTGCCVQSNAVSVSVARENTSHPDYISVQGKSHSLQFIFRQLKSDRTGSPYLLLCNTEKYI